MTDRLCMSGRGADFGGKWVMPCAQAAIHVIATEDADLPTLVLCEGHFLEVLEAGLVDEPYLPEAEIVRRRGGRPIL